MFRIVVFAALVFLGAVALVRAEEAGVIASMDEMRFAPPKEKGSASLVDGRVGKAVRFRFEADAPSTFFTSNIHGKPEWDRAQGFSFWVRGNGSDGFGGLEFIYDDDYAVRYDVCFPVKNGEWTKISVAWQDLVPVLPGPAAKPLGRSGGNAASKLSALFVGKWWYWADNPALCFDIDEIRLEPEIERDANDYLPDGPPLERVLANDRAVDRVRRATRGKADVLLITTNPSAARWSAIEELAEACRGAAKDRRAGLADTDRAFVAAGTDNPNPLFVHDRVHLSKAGHALVAETVLKAIEQKQKETVTKRSATP